MAINNLDELFEATTTGQSIPFLKTTTLTGVAGFSSSFWLSAGSPGAGVIPTSAAACSKATSGAIPFNNPTGENSHITHMQLRTGSIQSYELHDRLAHMAGLNGTLTSSQTVNLDIHTTGLGGTSNITQRKGRSDFSAVQWWIEWYVATGGTARTATVTYTNQNGIGSRTTQVAVPASMSVGRMLQIIPTEAGAGDFIRSVQSVALNGTTGTAGNFGITATLQRTEASVGVANTHTILDWGGLCCPIIYDDSCLFWVGLGNAVTVTPPAGGFILAQG